MDNLLIGVAGILATIIVGFGVYFRQRQYPGRITFAKESCIGLFDSIVRNLPELSVLYNNVPVKENLVLIKGFILNSGTIDIEENMTEEKLSINLPEGYKWLTSKKIPSTSEVRAQTNIVKDGSQLEFNMGLFRRGEHVHFEALAEVPSRENEVKQSEQSNPGKMLEKALIFSHRIGNTKKVEIQNILFSTQDPFRRSIFLTTAIANVLMAVILCILIYIGGIPKEIHYLFKLEDNKTIEAKIKPISYDTLKVRSIDNSYSKEILVDEFFSYSNLEPKIVRNNRSIPLIIILVVLVLVGMLLTLRIFLERYKSKKLSRLLSSDI